MTAVYPGASAETVAKTVGVPIEEQVNGVDGMIYMSSSSSSSGQYTLTVTFEVGTDIDMATVLLQTGEHSAGKFTGGCHTTGNYHEEAVYQHRHVLGVGIG